MVDDELTVRVVVQQSEGGWISAFVALLCSSHTASGGFAACTCHHAIEGGAGDGALKQTTSWVVRYGLP